MAHFSTLADIEAFESVPLAQRNLPDSTYQLLQRGAATAPDAMALLFFLQGTDYENAVTFTYQQLLAKMTQTANMLHGLGVGPQDTVSYILPNMPETYFTLYGGEAAGIANPINPLLEPSVMAEIMNSARTKVLVTLAPFPRTDVWEKVSSIVNQVPTLETILQVDIATYLRGVKKLVVSLLRLRQKGSPVRAKVLSFHKTLAGYPTDRLTSGRTIQPGDVAAYFHTGGTTGLPKLAKHTHANQVFDGWAVSETIDFQPGDRAYMGLPLFHNYGAIAIALSSWSSQSAVVMGTPQGFRGQDVLPNMWRILDHYNITLFPAVPTLYKTLLNVPINGVDLSRVKVSSSGAAALPVELARQFTQMTGIKILEGYGLTEATSVTGVNPVYGEARIGSVGLRLPYQQMRAARLEGGKFADFCLPDEVGTVIVRGPNVFPGYRDEFHNQDIFVDTGDGAGLWYNTGDLGREDKDGYLWLTGRQKELIIRGGHNIDPRQIEEALAQHPAVALVAAIGRPDARVGELPIAYVELKPNSPATKEELMTWAQEKIGERAAVPREIVIMNELPLTTVGKVHKLPLIWEQTSVVFQEEIGAMEGVRAVSIHTVQDAHLGAITHITVNPVPNIDSTALEERVRTALGHYTVRYELEVLA